MFITSNVHPFGCCSLTLPTVLDTINHWLIRMPYLLIIASNVLTNDAAGGRI